MKARLFVMMLFVALGFTANAQVANDGEVAAKKEATKEAVKGAVRAAGPKAAVRAAGPKGAPGKAAKKTNK